MSSADDSGIDDDEILYRRVLNRPDMVTHDENLGRWTPLNAAVRFDPDGMSVYLDSLLRSGGVGPPEVASERSGSVVFAVTALGARSLELGVQHTPAGPQHEFVAYAHGSIVGDPEWSDAELRSRRNQLRAQFILRWGTITVPP